MNNIFHTSNNKLIGHRGVAGLRPENTYCSFAYAADLGLQSIEFDTLLTLDEKWVVIHDDTLDRTTNGSGLVRTKLLKELETLEAGLWFSPPYPNQKIPTLIGVLKQAKKLNLFSNIEIKGAENTPELHAKLITELLSDNKTFDLANLMLSSFTLPCLIKIRQLMPKIQIGYLIEQFAADTIDIAKRYQFTSINCDVKKITEANLTAAICADLPVFLYTVNDPDTAKFWISKGAAALFTDRPDLL